MLFFPLSSNLLLTALQGDFLVHFMDIAREELTKKPEEISVEKLQVPLVLCCLFIVMVKTDFWQILL
jgi:hypothetical protein